MLLRKSTLKLYQRSVTEFPKIAGQTVRNRACIKLLHHPVLNVRRSKGSWSLGDSFTCLSRIPDDMHEKSMHNPNNMQVNQSVSLLPETYPSGPRLNNSTWHHRYFLSIYSNGDLPQECHY